MAFNGSFSWAGKEVTPFGDGFLIRSDAREEWMPVPPDDVETVRQAFLEAREQAEANRRAPGVPIRIKRAGTDEWVDA